MHLHNLQLLKHDRQPVAQQLKLKSMANVEVQEVAQPTEYGLWEYFLDCLEAEEGANLKEIMMEQADDTEDVWPCEDFVAAKDVVQLIVGIVDDGYI